MRFKIDRSNKSRTIYKYNFSNLTDLYDYLKTNPEINKNIFRQQASIEGKESSAGAPLPQAIDYLKGGYKVNFDKFAIDVKKVGGMKNAYADEDSLKLERCIHGGVYLQPLVAAGVHDCMARYSMDTDPKRITIYFQVACPHYITSEQIFNRGVATINLVRLLEEKGYLVDLKVFELSKYVNEYMEITINLKNVDEFLNVSKCYYPMVGKEFLRRVLFRVQESAPVVEDWGRGYGRGTTKEEVREFYNLREKDLIIVSPHELEIEGNNVYDDMYNFLKSLNLDDEFDLSEFKQKVKTK